MVPLLRVVVQDVQITLFAVLSFESVYYPPLTLCVSVVRRARVGVGFAQGGWQQKQQELTGRCV